VQEVMIHAVRKMMRAFMIRLVGFDESNVGLISRRVPTE